MHVPPDYQYMKFYLKKKVKKINIINCATYCNPATELNYSYIYVAFPTGANYQVKMECINCWIKSHQKKFIQKVKKSFN